MAMNRQELNEELVGILNRLVQNNPTQRFSQILANFGFIDDSHNVDCWKNEYYVEPTVVLQRVINNLKKYNNEL